MIILDGSFGEGGGQILRTALAFSMLTQKPFTINNIRAGRPKPGLKAQHIHCITALQQLSTAKASTLKLGAESLKFTPTPFQLKDIVVDVKTAGSLTLLLQSLLLPALLAPKEHGILLTLKGGTDVRWSPPADYYTDVFLPAIASFGHIDFHIKKRGYFPKGGGELQVIVGEKNKKIPLLEMDCLDEYLGDQLLPFLALSGGKITVPAITNHILSNIYTIEHFFPHHFKIEKNIISCKPIKHSSLLI